MKSQNILTAVLIIIIIILFVFFVTPKIQVQQEIEQTPQNQKIVQSQQTPKIQQIKKQSEPELIFLPDVVGVKKNELFGFPCSQFRAIAETEGFDIEYNFKQTCIYACNQKDLDYHIWKCEKDILNCYCKKYKEDEN